MDDADEDDETFTVALAALPASVTAGSPNSVTVTIADDDDPALSLAVSPNPVAEGGRATATVRLSGVTVPDGGLRVWLGVTDGTAVAGDDFTFSSPPAVSANATEIVIAAGATSGTATLAIIDDTEDEPDETVVLSASTDIARKSVDAADVMLTIGTGGGTGTGTGTGGGGGGGGGGSPTPSSDASLSALAISAGSLAFDSATTSYAVAVAHGVERVTLTPTVNQADATVAVNGSAVDSGQASAAIPLSVGENPVEVVVKAEDGSTRTYTVTVTRAAVTAALPTTLALSAAPDPAEGGPEVTVTATLDHPAPADGTRVTLATAGTARRDTGAVGDYTLSATTITIAAGETEGTATITVIDDAEEDGGETIVLGAASTNPSLTASLTLTIEDNDVTPVLALPTTLTLRAAPDAAEGGEAVTVTATLNSLAPADGTTVTLTTGGTATLDTDYILSSTTITITEGDTEGTAAITVTDDPEEDGGETVILEAASTNPALTAPPLTLTIEDNDAVPVPALPVGGALLLGMLLLWCGGPRGRACGASRVQA